MTVDLDEREWAQLMQIIMTREVWSVANPLLMRIGPQLEAQRNQTLRDRGPAKEPKTNSGEPHDVSAQPN